MLTTWIYLYSASVCRTLYGAKNGFFEPAYLIREFCSLNNVIFYGVYMQSPTIHTQDREQAASRLWNLETKRCIRYMWTRRLWAWDTKLVESQNAAVEERIIIWAQKDRTWSSWSTFAWKRVIQPVSENGGHAWEHVGVRRYDKKKKSCVGLRKRWKLSCLSKCRQVWSEASDFIESQL